MAQPANTFSTYDNADNIPESVDPIIRNLDPHEVPFLTAIGSGTAKNTYEEWLVDSLPDATVTFEIEGDDAVTDASSKATRIGNYTAIMDRVIRVSDTDEAVAKFGRSSDKSYQMMKHGKSLRLAEEVAVIGRDAVDADTNGQARRAGGDAQSRICAAVQSYITTNVVQAAAGSPANPTGDGSDSRTDGTPAAFTEAMLTDVLGQCWDNGASPSVIIAGKFNRGVISGFSGNADQVQHVNTDKKVINTVKVYEGDFHTLSVMPSRNIRDRDVLVVDPSYWEILYLQPYKKMPLARTGTSEREQLVVEFTLKASNEQSSGGIFDLTTSA
jgi:hypothetical protein